MSEIRNVSKAKPELFPRWKKSRQKLNVGVTDQKTAIIGTKNLGLDILL